MSRRDYLTQEARWAAEKSVTTQSQIDRRRDPKWVEQETDRLELALRRRSNDVRAAEAFLKEARQALADFQDPLERALETERLVREVDHWKRLAESALERCADREDEQALEGME